MNSERTAQLQVALASYDLKELRVQKRYLQEQGTAIDCTCFCSGEKLLAQLRQGQRAEKRAERRSEAYRQAEEAKAAE